VPCILALPLLLQRFSHSGPRPFCAATLTTVSDLAHRVCFSVPSACTRPNCAWSPSPTSAWYRHCVTPPQPWVQALVVFSRIGVYMRLPGVDVDRFAESMQSGGLMGYFDALTGGSISKVGVFSLGEPALA